MLIKQFHTAGRPSQATKYAATSVYVAIWCVIPPPAACAAPLSYQHPADASSTAHPEGLRVQMCLYACLQHPWCSSEHAAMPTAEPCLLASVAAPGCCLQAAPSGHPFAAGETCMTRQAQPIVDKCISFVMSFLANKLWCRMCRIAGSLISQLLMTCSITGWLLEMGQVTPHT